MKRIHLSVHDSPYSMRTGKFRARDEVLTAISPGKVLCLSTVWQGDLRPYVDSTLSAVEGLLAAPGLRPGHALSAEPSGANLDLGRTWLGDLAKRIKSNAADSTTPTPEGCDVTTVLAELEQVREALGTRAMNFGAVQDAIRRLPRSVDAVNARSKATVDAHPGIARNHRYGDFSKPVSGEDLNRNARTFWASDRSPKPQLSPPSRVGRPLPMTTNARGDEINRRNAEFWARRS